MKLGKNCVILGKNTTILEKNSAILSNIGKIYLLNWDFSANWECSRSIGNFFSQLGKNLVPETIHVIHLRSQIGRFTFQNREND